MKDGIGIKVKELPKLNLKLIMEIWDWIEFKQGVDGKPLWYQGEYAVPEVDPNAAWLRTEIEDQENDVALQALEDGYCGSAFCIAGYAGMPFQTPGQLATGGPPFYVEDVDGNKHSVSGDWDDAGRYALGLTEHEAIHLFSGGNTKEDIRRLLNKILESRGEEVRL